MPWPYRSPRGTSLAQALASPQHPSPAWPQVPENLAPTLWGEVQRASTGLNSPDQPPWASQTLFQPRALSPCPSNVIGCWSLALPQACWAQLGPWGHSGLSLTLAPLTRPDPVAACGLCPDRNAESCASEKSPPQYSQSSSHIFTVEARIYCLRLNWLSSLHPSSLPSTHLLCRVQAQGHLPFLTGKGHFVGCLPLPALG